MSVFVLSLSLGTHAPRPGPGLLPQEPWDPETSATGGTITRVSVGGPGVVYATNGVALFRSADGGYTWSNPSFESLFISPLDIFAVGPNALFIYSGDNGAGLLFTGNGGGSFHEIADTVVDKNASAAVFREDLANSRLGLVLTSGNTHKLYFNASFSDTAGWTETSTITEPDSGRVVSDAFLYWPLVGIITTSRDNIFGAGKSVLYYTLDGNNWTRWVNDTLGDIHDLEVAVVWDTSLCIMTATDRGLVVFGRNFPNDFKLFPFGPLSKVLAYYSHNDTVMAYLAPLTSSYLRRVMIIWRQNANGISVSVLDSVRLPEGVADARFRADTSIVAGTYGLGVLLIDLDLNITQGNAGLYAWNTMLPGGLWTKDTLAFSIDASGRVIKTSNGGVNWEILPLDPLTYGTSVAACPSKPDIVYAAAIGYEGTEVKVFWRSEDGGQTWRLVGQNYMLDPYIPIQMAVSWNDPDEVWAIRVNYSGVILPFYTTDGGESWQQVSGIPVSNFNWVTTTPDGTVYWATDQGVWRGRPGSWERVPGLPGKATCVFYSPGDSTVYALSTNAILRLENDTLRPLRSFSPAQTVMGAADLLGDIAVLTYSGNVATVYASADFGKTWTVDTPFVIPSAVGLLGGKVIVSSVGQGLRHGPWERPEPSLRLLVDPDSVEVGDTAFVTVEANVPLQAVVCTLYLPQDTLPVSLEPQNELKYKGEIHTAGLHGGQGVVVARATTPTGDSLRAEDSLLVTLPESGKIIVADSVFPWPNPAGDELYFHLYSELGAEVVAVLFNIEGRPVATAKAEITPKQATDLKVDISRVSSGLYVWKLVARSGEKKEVLTGKLAVRK